MNQSILDAIDRYAKKHCPVGDFLYSVLTNNLTESFGRADEENKSDLEKIVYYCNWHIPRVCWGSPEKVKKWLEDYKKKEE